MARLGRARAFPPRLVRPASGAGRGPILGTASLSAQSSLTVSGNIISPYPYVRSTGTVQLSVASETSKVIPLPAGWVVGDLCLIPASVRSSTGTFGSAPVGWVAVLGPLNASSNAASRHVLYGRILQSGDTDPTVTFTSGRIAAQSVSIANHGLNTIGDLVAGSASSATTSTSIPQPDITPPTDFSLWVSIVSATHSTNGTTWTVTPDASMTAEVLDIVTNIAAQTNAGIEVATKPIPSAGTHAATTATATQSVEAVGMSIAIRPLSTNPSAFLSAQSTLTASANVGTASITHMWTGAATTTSIRVNAKLVNTSTARLKVSTTSDLLTSPSFSSSVTPDAQGYTDFSVTGLSANTQYYYGIELNGTVASSPQGSFKTSPSGAANFSFAFGSCNIAGDNSTAFSNINARSPAFMIMVGDTPYIDVTTNDQTAVRTPREQFLILSNIKTIAQNYPLYYTWSDHDFGSNNADGTSASKPAQQAVYRQMVPSPPLVVSDGIYSTFVWGRVRFIITDNRSFKSPITDTDNSSKTVLGTTQKTWFKDLITNSTEPVIFWVNEQPWIGTATGVDDEWFGYNTERQELATHIQNSGKRVVILSGDMHAVAADNGLNSPGKIPVFHAAPLANSFSNKGGPYTHGPYPTSGATTIHQYGYVSVVDNGTEVTVTYTGYDDTNVARVTVTLLSGSAVLSAQSTLTSSGVVSKIGTSSLSGDSTLTSSGTVSKIGTAALSIQGTLTSSGVVSKIGTSSLSGDSTLSASGTVSGANVASLSGQSTLTITGILTKFGIASLSGDSTLISSGTVSRVGVSTLSGQSTFTVTGTLTKFGISTLSGDSGLTSSGTLTRFGVSTFSVQSTLTADGVIPGNNAAVLSGQSTFTVTGTLTKFGISTLSGDSGLISSGTVSKLGVSTLSIQSTLTSSGTLSKIGTSVLSGDSGLTVTGILTKFGTSALSGDSSLTSSGTVSKLGVSTLSIQSTLTASGAVSSVTGAFLSGQSTLTAVGRITALGSVILSGDSTFTITSKVNTFGQVTLSIQSSLLASGAKVLFGTVTLSIQSNISASGDTSPPWAFDFIELTYEKILSGKEGNAKVVSYEGRG